MADTTATLTAGDWTLLTTNDVSAISLKNQGGLTAAQIGQLEAWANQRTGAY